MDKGQMNLQFFIYDNHIEPQGLLPRLHAKEASAAWHFAKLALIALQRVPEQVTYEGNLDKTVHLMRIANAVSLLYQLPLDSFMKFIPLVQREAMAKQLGWDDRLTAWWTSAGRAYDEVTREEGRLNIQ